MFEDSRLIEGERNRENYKIYIIDHVMDKVCQSLNF